MNALPQAAQQALQEQLGAIRSRLLGPGPESLETDLDVSVMPKASGVIAVSVRTNAGAPRHGSPSTATFELRPQAEGEQVTYRSTEVEYSSAEL